MAPRRICRGRLHMHGRRAARIVITSCPARAAVRSSCWRPRRHHSVRGAGDPSRPGTRNQVRCQVARNCGRDGSCSAACGSAVTAVRLAATRARGVIWRCVLASRRVKQLMSTSDVT